MNLRIFKYNLPFQESFKTAKETFQTRVGVLMQLKKKNITAWGEAAPLPGYSQESLQQVLAQIEQIKDNLKSLLASDFSMGDFFHFCSDHQMHPSLQFALYTLGCTYLAQTKNRSLHQLLFPNAPRKISLNAVIDLGQKGLLEQVKQGVAKGFTTIKIKALSTEHFIRELENVRKHYPSLTLRLDANQGWSMQEAKRFLEQVAPLDIAYCEEPLHQPTEALLTELQQYTKVPIALDESLIDRFTLEEAHRMVPVLIIKPMMINLAGQWPTLSSLATENRVKRVFTSSLESGIGRLMTATLAAGLGSKNAAHGVATGNRLQQDIWNDDSFITSGTFTLPGARGLQQLMQKDDAALKLKKIIDT